MELMNEAATNIGESAPFSDITINQWREAEKDPNGISASGYPNYVAYPNTDWYDEIYSNDWMMKHSLSVTGQEGRTGYNLSISYTDNPGLIKDTGYQRYFCVPMFIRILLSGYVLVLAYGGITLTRRKAIPVHSPILILKR